jgi:Pvc16 N-terminal domain/IPT/TIG domain
LSSTQAINDINKTLYRVLRESFGVDDQDAQIKFGPPTDESNTDDTRAGLYVFLYNIVEDPFHRNLPNEIRGGEHILSIRPPLGINLYYMLTPFSPSVEGRESLDDIRAHTLIAKAIRAFNENGVVDPRFFPANTVLGSSQVKISPTQMNLEEITKIWGSFNRPFRLSMCYEVSIAWVTTAEQARELFLVEKPVLEGAPAIGKKSLAVLKIIGGDIVKVHSEKIGEVEADIRPIAVQPGMALSVFGKNFQHKKLRVRIDNTELDEKSFRVIDENLLKIKIPPNETAGIKKLSLKADKEEDMLITFEVLPSEIPRIRITEIRPEAAESGDLITIYGINFTDDVKVNIGGIDARSMTVVDRAQVNVMIPEDVPTGATTITVRNEKGTASKQFVIE